MQRLVESNPTRYSARAEIWSTAQKGGEREVLFRGRIDPRAVDTSGMRSLRYGGRLLQVVAAAMTVYDMGSATTESVRVSSPRPIAVETVRHVSGWSGAVLGAKAGAGVGSLVGIESGPGAILTGAVGGLIGGVAGYFGADWMRIKI
ncbi:hypothetical protein [Bacillus safensis]|uniref:hypothetical protein n=1 Tax=Bacillus safensis TaxID=561879 RepID=UPI0036E89E97